MNKSAKYLSFLSLCLLATACQDDFVNENVIVTPGQEIVFGGSAYFESGEEKVRTEYGDVIQKNGKSYIQVKWVAKEDSIDIACPQAADLKKAQYQVGSGVAMNDGNDVSVANTLIKTTPVALQWAGNFEHNFCAVYPSVEKIKKRVLSTHADKMDLTVTGENVTLKGYVPSTQPAEGVEEVMKEGNLLGYTVNPDMTYAYMVANKKTQPSTDPIGLDFESIVTAVQLKITANDIMRATTTDEDPDYETLEDETITITGVALEDGIKAEDENGSFVYKEPICGAFTYNFADKSYEYPTYNNNANFDESQVQVVFDPLTLSAGQFIDVTFFLLPGKNLNIGGSGELKLVVYYKTSEGLVKKSAQIAKELEAGRKYYVNDVLLPPVKLAFGGVSGYNWFNQLPEQALFSQVSMPVAGNVFAVDGTTNVHASNSQQVKDYITLWNMGVRGFEFVNPHTMDYTNDNIGSVGFVCAEQQAGNTTFATAFEKLADQLRANPNETLVLLCTYMAMSGLDGYKPEVYVRQVLNYFEKFIAAEKQKKEEDPTYNAFTKDDFVQLTSSTTVKQLKGNIAVIFRPGDDCRMEYKINDNFTSGIELKSTSGDWKGNVLLVQDWGTAQYDVWDRRYGDGYARAATFLERKNYVKYQEAETKPKKIETSIIATSNNRNNPPSSYEEMPKLLSEFNFKHGLTGSTGTAHVQEWMRVAPKDETLNTTGRYTGLYATIILYTWYYWTRWSESITEKKEAIKDLFNYSVAEKGKANNNLYINVLSGYYIDWHQNNTNTYHYSLRPFTESEMQNNSNQGKGGNFKLLAYDLNKYVYDLIYNKQLNQEGPLGLVVMDHIGNNKVKPLGSGSEAEVTDDKSEELVDLIVMQNFKFTMHQGQ